MYCSTKCLLKNISGNNFFLHFLLDFYFTPYIFPFYWVGFQVSILNYLFYVCVLVCLCAYVSRKKLFVYFVLISYQFFVFCFFLCLFFWTVLLLFLFCPLFVFCFIFMCSCIQQFSFYFSLSLKSRYDNFARKLHIREILQFEFAHNFYTNSSDSFYFFQIVIPIGKEGIFFAL